MVSFRTYGVAFLVSLAEALLHNNSSSDITVLASSRAVVGGILSEATLVVNTTTGKIVSVYNSVRPSSEFPPGTAYADYSPKLLLPGLLDAHVHLNEPGRTEWEGFWTGMRAAASGGVTTLIDMPPNTLPPTTTVENLITKVRAADGQCWVDVGFHGGLIPNNTKDLKPLVDAGVRSFKGFLIESGMDEFPAIGPNDIEAALLALADSLTTVIFHAEMVPPNVTLVGSGAPYTGPLTSYQTYLDSRPPTLETYAISQILSKAYLAPDLDLHIVHLSAAEGLPMLREARDQGVRITAETCFHYLSLGLGLSILWTEAANHGASIEDIVRWTSTNTARQVGLEQEKGDIDVGFDGDIVVFDDAAEFEVNKETVFFRNEVSPFDGKSLKGVVEETWIHGQKIFDHRTGFNEEQGPIGKTILEPRRRQAVKMI